MKTCDNCKIENPDDALFCRNCGEHFKKIEVETPSQKRGWKKFWTFLLVIALIGGFGWGIWYSSLPSYISVSDNKIELDPRGGEQTIIVSTDASNDEWDINYLKSSRYDSWLTVEKRVYGLKISYNANEMAEDRTATIDLYTLGRYFYDTIELTQKSDKSIRGSIYKVWGEYNVYDLYSRYGMRIHVHFSVKNMKGIEGLCAAYFYNSDNSEALNDMNENFRTADGKVAISEVFTPPYDSSEWEDFTLFIPYDELHLGVGNWSLYFDILIYIESTSEAVVRFDKHQFALTQ